MTTREIRLVQTVRPFDYKSPFPDEEHTLLVCVLDDSMTNDERNKLALEIVAAKCRFALCWGFGCATLETEIDFAYIETDENFTPPDDRLIITTSHEGEPIDDAMEYWWIHTSFDGYESTNLAILIVGDDKELVSEIHSKAGERNKG